MSVRFETWKRELVTLADASFVPLDPQDIISEEGTVISGATRHKLEEARVSAPAEVNGVASRLSGALSWAGWQAIRWIPDQDDADPTFWGIILKQATKYGTSVRDNKIDLGVIRDPGHTFFHSRPVSLDGEPVDGTGAPADNFMKDLVAACFAGATPGGTSKAWDFGGELAIEADSSEASTLDDLEEFDGWLDDVLDAIGEKYNVDWELLPSVTGSTITWTFNTKSPRGGTDRTSGAGRVVIDDFAGSAPSGERYQDRAGLVNEWVQKGGVASTKDVASQAAWGVWIGITDQETVDGRLVDLALSVVKDGSEWAYEDALTGAVWMTDFHAGDLVIKANSRTNEAEASAKIEAVSWSWPSGILRTEIRWGDKRPTYTNKNKDRAHGGGGGGGADSSGDLPSVHQLTGDRHNELGLTAGNVLRATAPTTFAFGALQASDLPLHDIITKHSASGLTASHVLRATGATTFAFGALQAGDLPTIGADTQVIFNDGGALAGNNGLTFVKATGRLQATIVAVDATRQLDISGTALRVTNTGGNVNIISGASRRLAIGSDVTVENGDLAIGTTGKGITHVDATATGQVLRYNGTRFVPGKVAIGDLSATHQHTIAASGTHTHGLTRSTRKYTTTLVSGHQHEVDVYGSDLIGATTDAGGDHAHGGNTGAT